MKLPNSIEALIDRLSELPSIGPRQATRLVFHLAMQGKQALRALAESIDTLGALKLCSRCFFIHEEAGNLCSICADPKRDSRVLMIVEKETDLLSVERTGKFTGTYVIIGAIGKIGLLEEWQKLRLQALKSFIEKEQGGTIDEIIVGFNPGAHGDWHASSLAKELSGLAKKITRLGRGLPTGGEIEFADDDTLGAALERRS
jgi:recombination protein RecR